MLDGGRRELSRSGETVHVSPKAFRLLEMLIAAAPDAVSRDDLYAGLWPDTYVDEANLPNLVAEIRKALEDDSRNPRFVKTVHGFGYAFIGAVESDGAWSTFVLQWGGREFPLREGVSVIGRDATADVQIESAGVSRRHASINANGGTATIRDLESKNGTFVDGLRVDGGTVVSGDSEIRLGSAVLRVRRISTEQSTMTVAPLPGADS